MAFSRYSDDREMRMRFSGYKEDIKTFLCDDTVNPGDFVSMSDNFKVTKSFGSTIGICISVVNNGLAKQAAIQTAGYVEAECDMRIAVGYRYLYVSKDNKVIEDPTGQKYGDRYLVVYSNNSHVVGFMLK